LENVNKFAPKCRHCAPNRLFNGFGARACGLAWAEHALTTPSPAEKLH
jgi:hypothetical protein